MGRGGGGGKRRLGLAVEDMQAASRVRRGVVARVALDADQRVGRFDDDEAAGARLVVAVPARLEAGVGFGDAALGEPRGVLVEPGAHVLRPCLVRRGAAGSGR